MSALVTVLPRKYSWSSYSLQILRILFKHVRFFADFELKRKENRYWWKALRLLLSVWERKSGSDYVQAAVSGHSTTSLGCKMGWRTRRRKPGRVWILRIELLVRVSSLYINSFKAIFTQFHLDIRYTYPKDVAWRLDVRIYRPMILKCFDFSVLSYFICDLVGDCLEVMG